MSRTRDHSRENLFIRGADATLHDIFLWAGKRKKIEIKYQSVFHSAVWPQSLSFQSQIRLIFGRIPVYDFVQKPAVGLILSFRSRNYWYLSSKLREILALILLLFLKAVIWLFMFSYYVSSRVEKHLFLARTTMKDLKRKRSL